jgi:hypothetical protein
VITLNQKYSHQKLVEYAVRWLRWTMKCKLISAEKGCWATSESPDAIGWTPLGHSVLVECKTSRSDFLADKAKPHRRYAGMGMERWFLVPPGIVTPEDLPKNWGLIEVRKGKVYRLHEAKTRPIWAGQVALAEQPLLIATARRALWGNFKGLVWEPKPVEEVGKAE